MYPGIFSDLGFTAMIIYAVWWFHQYGSHALKTHMVKQKYYGLYELTKIEEQLKKRGHTFANLNKFGEQFEEDKKEKEPGDVFKQIDEHYAKDEGKAAGKTGA